MLESIEVTTPPAKTEYAVGDALDLAGMKVTAHYTNGGADRLLDEGEYTVDPVDMSTPGTKNVTVRHMDNDIEKTHYFTILVKEAAPTAPTEPDDPDTETPFTGTQETDGGAGTDDDSTGTGGGMPKTGVDDTASAMKIVFMAAALTALVLLARAVKKKQIAFAKDTRENGSKR